MRKAILLSLSAALLTTLVFILVLAAPDGFHVERVFVDPGMVWVFFSLFLTCFFVVLFLLSLTVMRKTEALLKEIRTMRTKPGSSNTGDPLGDLQREVKEFSEERRNEIEHLKKLETYRKEFLGNVSHELKTPIFNIQGYVLTLLDGGLDDPKINRDYLHRAEKSVDRMIAIVEDLQAITQFESGELVLEMDRFDIVALVQDVIQAQELVSRSRKVSLEFVNENPKSLFVMGDRFRIRQALVNLVVNSVKYGKENGTTQLRVHDIGEKVRVEVADNGIGIPKEHLPRIFERFYRVDKSRSREMGGTGLGLSIVKHIIEAHGQTIDVMSTEGAGSVFSFTLKKA